MDTASIRLTFARLAPRTDSGSPSEDDIIALFDRLRVPLLRYLACCRVPVTDAEEIVQEVFLLLFQRRDKLEREPAGWVFKAAHNYVLKHRERSRREAESAASSPRALELLVDKRAWADAAFEERERRNTLMAVVRALPEQDQHCLHLRAEGLRYREIAEVLGMSLGWVANSLERSIARIGRADAR